jgi:transcriptional regulator
MQRMFTPPPFAEDTSQALTDVIARARIGVLVSSGARGLQATHLPLLYEAERGVLLGHVSRANLQAQDSGEALAIFQATEAYVSPSWYPSKAQHGRAVPTWNYEAAHVYGRLSWFREPERLREILERLTDRHEQGRTEPWRVSDAPSDYTARLINGIVGVELAIERVEISRKLSQNKDEADRAGVVAGLRSTGDARDAALADQMERR